MEPIPSRIKRWFKEAVGKAEAPADEWDILKDKYTGAMLVLHLVFAGLYFLPLFIRLLVLSGTLPGATESELEKLRGVLEQDVSVWELLVFGFLGNETVAGWIGVALSFALLSYNVLRVLLTTRVGHLRRREGHPARHKYHWMYRIHMPWMYVLFVLSVSSIAYRVYDSLNLRNILPG